MAVILSTCTGSTVATTRESGKVGFGSNGRLLGSENLKMLKKGNKTSLRAGGYIQGARYLPARDPPHICIKAAVSAESTGEKKSLPEDAKKALIRAVANTDRGKTTTPEQRKRILKMIIELENSNPTENPVSSAFLSGYWSLLYTAPVDERTADKYAGTQEGPFLARVKPFAFGSIKQTRSSQKRLAIRILSQDCNSGPCGTKKRNRLSTAQLERLVYCHCNLRLLDHTAISSEPRQMNVDKIDIEKVKNISNIPREELDIYTIADESGDSETDAASACASGTGSDADAVDADTEEGVAKNIAEFTFLGKNGALTIEGSAAPSCVKGKETTRLEVKFKNFFVRLGGWTSPIISLQWINPQGWVDTTYLDHEMRIGRGDKGSVFLAVRAKM
ncbi:hypothetical protein L7F22_000177 [Adiantum nelumboides]|nr:hypothetical protein [Adiantum nelumboides]